MNFQDFVIIFKVHCHRYRYIYSLKKRRSNSREFENISKTLKVAENSRNNVRLEKPINLEILRREK